MIKYKLINALQALKFNLTLVSAKNYVAGTQDAYAKGVKAGRDYDELAEDLYAKGYEDGIEYERAKWTGENKNG